MTKLNIKNLKINEAIHCPTADILHTILVMYYGNYMLENAISAWKNFRENTIWFPPGRVEHMRNCKIPSYTVYDHTSFIEDSSGSMVDYWNHGSKNKELSHYNIN